MLASTVAHLLKGMTSHKEVNYRKLGAQALSFLYPIPLVVSK